MSHLYQFKFERFVNIYELLAVNLIDSYKLRKYSLKNRTHLAQYDYMNIKYEKKFNEHLYRIILKYKNT